MNNKTPLPKIGSPATRALNSIGITTLEGLSNHTEKEISNLHGMGPKALGILKTEMKKLSLSYKA